MGSKTCRTVATRSIFLYWDIGFRRRRRYRPPVQRQMWVRPWNRADRRPLFGHWDNLLPQLRQEDPESWFNYMRMRPEMFARVTPLCRFEPYCSLIAPVLFPCLPYCSRFFPIFPCFSSTGQYDGGGWLFSPDLPVFTHFSPFLPPSSRVIPDPLLGLPVFSRIANIWRNGPIRDMCNGGIKYNSKEDRLLLFRWAEGLHYFLLLCYSVFM